MYTVRMRNHPRQFKQKVKQMKEKIRTKLEGWVYVLWWLTLVMLLVQFILVPKIIWLFGWFCWGTSGTIGLYFGKKKNKFA